MESILDTIRSFASEAHAGQKRKYTPEPYIVHPIRVSELSRQYDSRLPIAAAALLHNVLEDTDVSESALSDFLYSVMEQNDAIETLRLVVELTDVFVKSDYPQWNRRIRKDKELDRIMKTSPEAQTIKYADILDNVNEISSHDPDFAPRYLRECLAILQKADKGNPILREKALESVV